MPGRRRAILTLASYAVISTAVSASFFVGYFQAANDKAWFWLVLAVFQAALLSSLIPFRSVLLRQISAAATLLITVNLFSPLLPLGEPLVTLVPSVRHQIRVVGDVMPGFSGVQTITTDSEGHRTNKPVDYRRKTPNVLRVVAFGGSSTEDIFLDDAKTWTSLLAARLSKELDRPVEMINTGVSGLRAVHHLASLRDSERYSPDVAIFMIGINDWIRQIRRSQQGGFEKVFDYLGSFSVNRTVLFRAMRQAFRSLTGLLSGGPLSDGQVFDEDGADRSSHSLSRPDQRSLQVAEVSKDYEISVGAIIAECKKRRIVCFLVDQATAYDPSIEPALKPRLWMTPSKEEYTLSLEDMSQIARFYNAWLEREARKKAIPFCGVAKDVPPTTGFFYDDCHFNEGGAQRIAQLLSACMGPTIRSELLEWRDRKN